MQELGPLLMGALGGQAPGSEHTAALYKPVVHFTDWACQVRGGLEPRGGYGLDVRGL